MCLSESGDDGGVRREAGKDGRWTEQTEDGRQKTRGAPLSGVCSNGTKEKRPPPAEKRISNYWRGAAGRKQEDANLATDGGNTRFDDGTGDGAGAGRRQRYDLFAWDSREQPGKHTTSFSPPSATLCFAGRWVELGTVHQSYPPRSSLAPPRDVERFLNSPPMRVNAVIPTAVMLLGVCVCDCM